MNWFWGLAVLYLLAIIFFAFKENSPVLVLSFLNFVILVIFYVETRKNNYIFRIENKIDEIEKILKKIDTLRDEQTSSLIKAFEVEMDLSKYKNDQEDKYRELAKKILQLDNKLNEKYELLGKSIIRLSKDIKKD